MRGEGSDDSAPSEEFYDCDTPGASGCHGNPTGGGYRDNPPHQGLNLMARISQSMLELREPPAQQPFKFSSKSPSREAHGRVGGAKVVIAKPGGFPGPSPRRVIGGASSPRRMIGGARYWQDRLSTGRLASSPSRAPAEPHTHTRHGRSPRRQSLPSAHTHTHTSSSSAQRYQPHTHTHSPSPLRTHTLSRTRTSPRGQVHTHTLAGSPTARYTSSPSSAHTSNPPANPRGTKTALHTSSPSRVQTSNPLGLPPAKPLGTKTKCPGGVAKGNTSRKK
ncbi:rho GTPase-activating protein 17 [Alosa alosa]|nr:rho GTPase-activating protein 17 [Alosa alosa]